MKKPKKPKAKRPSAPSRPAPVQAKRGRAELGSAALAFLGKDARPQARAAAPRPVRKADLQPVARQGIAALGSAARAFLKRSPAEPTVTSAGLSPAPSIGRSLSAALDQRELVTLLLLPFFLLAFALGMSQSWRHPAWDSADAPIASRGSDPEVARAPIVLAPATPATLPAALMPAEAPPVDAAIAIPPPASRVSPPTTQLPQVELATPAPVMPADAPSIDLPEVALAAPATAAPPLTEAPKAELAAPAPAVPAQTARLEVALAKPQPTPAPVVPALPPVIEAPRLELAAPVPVLPVEPPQIVRPQVALATPAPAIPVEAPAILSRPADIAALPAEALPRVELPEAAPAPKPPEQKEARLALPPGSSPATPASEPTMCPVIPGFGKPAYSVRPVADGEDFGERLAAAAREQTSEFVVYNDAYRRISFPMGDVNPMYGVCTDVIIRAYRALGVDLQELIAKARVGSGDTSMQHRRVDTMRKFFAAKGASLPITSYPEDYRPGDVVSYHRPQNAHSRTHIAIVSDVVAPSGRLMIVHNRGWGPQLEDALFVDKITGHYRFTVPAATDAVARAAPAVPSAAGASVVAPAVQKRPAAAPATRTVVKATYTPAPKAPGNAASAQAARNGLPSGPQ